MKGDNVYIVINNHEYNEYVYGPFESMTEAYGWVHNLKGNARIVKLIEPKFNAD